MKNDHFFEEISEEQKKKQNIVSALKKILDYLEQDEKPLKKKNKRTLKQVTKSVKFIRFMKFVKYRNFTKQCGEVDV